MTKEELLNNVDKSLLPKTVGLIVDGNGRWAKSKRMPRSFGHAEGIKTLIEIVDSSIEIGIKNLICYCFSTENWNRPLEEVNFLMKAFIDTFDKYINRLVEKDIKVLIIGEKDNLSSDVLKTIDKTTDLTKDCKTLNLFICFNYGSRKEIISCVKDICKDVENKKISIDDIDEDLFNSKLYTKDVPNIDLLIRTSGEQRVSNFMLWQLSYSEMIFPKTYFPDFHKEIYFDCIYEYLKRDRRFGSIK